MEKQVLSIAQMQKLKELGVDTSKASIYWMVQTNGTKIGDKSNLQEPYLSLHKECMVVGFDRYEAIPTFTLQDMIELMPEQIDGYPLTYDVLSNQFYGFKIGVHYMPKCEYNSVIYFAFDIICSLAEKGYLKDN